MRTPQGYWAFIPAPLPPKIDYDAELLRKLTDADRSLGELSGTGKLLPNPYLLISPAIHREAVASSRIEGTLASLSDLFFFEAEEPLHTKVSDVQEVRNYVLAMEYGLQRLNEIPISVRLIKEIHKILMQDVRGGKASPGEIRRIQNWIGHEGSSLSEAIFVPPPPNDVMDALSQLEKYLHSSPQEPLLIQCAMMHYQFEAIHPFLDGNGRVGRLLITFFLCERKCLGRPLLYLSNYFEKTRDAYYAKLLAVSRDGDWGGWLKYFLEGVATQSRKDIETAGQILNLNAEYRKLLETKRKIPAAARRLIDEIFLNPFVSISKLSKKWGMPYNSVKTGVLRLMELGILERYGQARRNKLFVAPKLMDILIRDPEQKVK